MASRAHGDEDPKAERDADRDPERGPPAHHSGSSSENDTREEDHEHY
jgi:hypothetical protein